MSALDTQVGGGHYKDMAIQPLEYILANKLNFIEGNIIKYITRYHLKGGIEDVEKVIHYATILKEQLAETKKVQQAESWDCSYGPRPVCSGLPVSLESEYEKWLRSSCAYG